MESYGVCPFGEASSIQHVFGDLFMLLYVSVACSFLLLNTVTWYEYITVLFIESF